MPVSATTMIACSSSAEHVTSTRPPLSVNFTAFERRFTTTCRSFSESARAEGDGMQSTTASVSPFARAWGATSDSAAVSTSRTGTLAMS